MIHAMDAFAGAIGVSDSDGKGTPVYAVCQPRADANAHYYAHIVREMARTQWILALAKGIRERSTDFRFDGFASQLVPVPPVDEQAAIVRFLDHADRRIRRYIRAKRQLITLLNEQKQAIIHRAVTRGLDPNVRLKPSGFGWLGDIPEHWRAVKLRYLSKQIVDGTHFTPTYVDEGVPFVRVTDIATFPLEPAMLRKITEEEHHEINKRCAPAFGDLLISKNGSIGITRVVDWEFACSIYVSLCLIKLFKTVIDPYFVSFAFQGGLLERQLSEVTKTTSVTNLHLDKIRGLVVPVPPLDEQDAILVWAKNEVRPIDDTIERSHKEISLLAEYRTRLIADVVTGKLDVREAAARLPDDVDDEDMAADELLEGDDAIDDAALDAEPEEVEA